MERAAANAKRPIQPDLSDHSPLTRRSRNFDKTRIGGNLTSMFQRLFSVILMAVTITVVESAAPTVSVVLLDQNGQNLPTTTMEKVIKTDEEWRAQLGDGEVYQVTRGKGTERPFCGAFHDHKKDGIYYCVCCDLPLFRADAKFDSGTGWPSFFQPVAKENVVTAVDRSHGMMREEILCARCDSHLGHVFPDGPPPSGLRYCVNSVSLKFVPEEKE
jgi:methionine-R-sulfoxide reductase